MKYEAAKIISLKNHPQLNETWLQQVLQNNPEILGLGDLEFKEAERRQSGGGRLDLLFQDTGNQTRYEVEVQLGATDPSHIIRTIEYWDLERNRHPNWDHVAVLVAEEVTSRFLNVIALFNKTIPLILIQLKAIELGETVSLVPTIVLNLNNVEYDDEETVDEPKDRNYWSDKASPETIAVFDSLFELINHVNPGSVPKYNKYYIGATKDGLVSNSVVLKPKKQMVVAEIRLDRSNEIDELIENAGLDVMPYIPRWGRYRIRVYPSDLAKNRDVLLDIFGRAFGISRNEEVQTIES
jgi:hypothetical protein